MTSHLTQAIRDAKSAGFSDDSCEHGCEHPLFGRGESNESRCLYDRTYCTSRLLLSPAFWSALGKSRGWRNTKPEVFIETIPGGLVNRTYHVFSWQNEWHRFIDYLAEGGDVQSFFKSISTNN